MRDYNFSEHYGRKKSSIDVRSPLFAGALIVILCAMIAIFLNVRNIILIGEIKNVNTQVETLSSNPVYLGALATKERIEALHQYEYSAETVLEQFNQGNVITTEFLRALEAEIPSAVRFTALDINNAAAFITVEAPNRKAVAESVLRLKESNLFQDVSFETVDTLEGVNAVTVVINATMKAGENK